MLAKPYEVARIPYEARFYFDVDDGLTAVILSYAGKPVQTAQAYDELLRLLDERCGNRKLNKDFNRWEFGDTGWCAQTSITLAKPSPPPSW